MYSTKTIAFEPRFSWRIAEISRIFAGFVAADYAIKRVDASGDTAEDEAGRAPAADG